MESPQFAHGKICYLMLPCGDPDELGSFYKRVFGWDVRDGGSFDDAVGGVSGMFMPRVPPASDPLLDLHIMVDDLYSAITAIEESGGELVKDFTGDPDSGTEKWAWFRDPYGNRLGIYEHPVS